MATALTLAQMRDYVWRLIQVVPQWDVDGSTLGTLAAGFSEPNKNTTNQAINEGIDAINRVVRIGAVSDLSPIAVNPAPIWKRGPYYIDFYADEQNSLDVAEVTDVVWVDGGGISYRLEPYDYYGPAREFMPYLQYSQEPHPRQYFMLGNQIGVLPAPNQAGTLYVTQMEGIPPLVNDTDPILYLPINYHAVVRYYAAMVLSARAAMDVEANDRFVKYRDLALNGLVEIYTWKNGYNQDSIDAIKSTLQMRLPSVAATPMDQQAAGVQNAPQQPGQGQ